MDVVFVGLKKEILNWNGNIKNPLAQIILCKRVFRKDIYFYAKRCYNQKETISKGKIMQSKKYGLKHQTIKKSKLITKMFDFGFGSDAGNWEDATRHYTGYSPTLTRAGDYPGNVAVSSGGYSLYDSPYHAQSQELGRTVQGALQNMDANIYSGLNREAEKEKKAKVYTNKTPEEINQITNRISGYSPSSVKASDLRNNIKNVTANLANIPVKEAKSILSLLKTSDPQKQITARQIDNAFSQKSVVSILNNAKSISEVKTKISAGIKMAEVINSGAKNYEKK